jgi:hypothetical protein
MILVPPIEQWGNYYTVGVPNSAPWTDVNAGFWLDIAIQTGNRHLASYVQK